MRKWNVVSLAMAVCLSGSVVSDVFVQETKAQQIEVQETQETELEQETQTELETNMQSETEGEVQEQSEVETQTEEQTQPLTWEDVEQTQSETETELELLEEPVSQEPTMPAPDDWFDSYEKLVSYVRDQMVQRETEIQFTVAIGDELSRDEIEELLATILMDVWEPTNSSKEGDALYGDTWDFDYSFQKVIDGEYWGYCFRYIMAYETNAQQEKELQQAISETVSSFQSDGASNYELVRRIYDYICSNVKYDYVHQNDENYLLQHSAYAAMLQHMTSDEGYATLFYRMCQEAGISARTVRGFCDEEYHSWNIVELDGKWYNVDAAKDAYDSPFTRNYQWFLKSDADFGNHVVDDEDVLNPTEDLYARSETSYDVPEADRSFVGLVYVDGIWKYYRNGGFDESFSGLVPYNGANYYVENGTINWDYTGLVLDKGIWRFVRYGCLDESYTGLTQYYGTWYYVENGVLNWHYTGLANYNGSWYAIESGRLNWNYNGLMLHNGSWYYISNGCLDWDYTGLTLYYGTWYYIYKGCLNWGYTGLTYYNSAWYYVESGVMNWNYTGLTLYNGCWYYVEGSLIRWNYTGLVEYYGKQYYVENSSINWNYTGSYMQDGIEYQIYYGTVVG